MASNPAQAALQKYFGYKNFRPMQAEIIQSISEGKDVLVLMPTGGGKSICYQIPAITHQGTALVVSPLISLMKDQVEALLANGVKAAFLNSTLSGTEQQQVEDAFFSSYLDLLYISPEKLLSSAFQPLLRKASINLFAIDEAHCISSWGHDFRPEYTRLRWLKKNFPDTPIVALTATADEVTRKDIVRQLSLPQPVEYVASFDRPNLSLEVRPAQRRFEQILSFIKRRPEESGIIYCLSRKRTEQLSARLRQEGVTAKPYHAGLSSGERNKTQEAFIKDEVPVICATIAFGMGIDKSNVRFILHYNLPKNVESYYQQIGRAGRDGLRADTILFYSFGDVSLMRDILQKNESEQTAIQLAKLERMKQYAESLICRRRFLLNYFGEPLQTDCGNCDICKNPPEHIDGTTIAQKALSAVYRLREKAGLNTLINVLRGSRRKDILDKGYDRIKTYGAGGNLSFTQWQNYILQLANLGYLRVAHEKNDVIQLRPASREVLFEGKEVALVRLASLRERRETEKAEQLSRYGKKERQRDELFQKLRQLRKQLAQEKGVPPYIIFSDATLADMCKQQPLNEEQFRKISGVGVKKLHQYGSYFLEIIIDHLSENKPLEKGSTYELTLELYRQGLGIKEISEKRDMAESTVRGHILKLYQAGEDIDPDDFIPTGAGEKVLKALPYLQQPPRLKDIYEYLNGEVDYFVIKMALAKQKREKTV